MTPNTKQRLLGIATRLDDLGRRSMNLWLEAGLDPLGGAHGFLDRRFRPVLDDESDPRGPSGEVRGDQFLVQQARHLYAYAVYAERYPSETGAAHFAHQLQAHLFTAFERTDTFLQVRARNGRERTREAQLYVQGFAIFALATYGRVFASTELRQRVHRHFELLDARLHDAEQGGYEQSQDGGWLEFVSAPPGAAKCTNTHIHVLETLTALLRIAPAVSLLRGRTIELLQLFATRLRQPMGNLHPFFDAAWQPVGPPRVSYGHDVEGAWLMLDALDVLTATGDVPAELPVLVQTASLSMVAHALRTGWDPAGGFFDHGVPEGAAVLSSVLGREKVWWAQAEALPGLYRAYRLTGDETLVTRLEETTAFLSQRSWDQECGGYFWSVDSEGRPLGRGDHKGEFWKTPYHDVRACLLTADWIREDC